MDRFSRRAVLATGGAGLGLGMLPAGLRQAMAAGPVKTRYSAHSDEGRAMLAIYAIGVRKMMELDTTNPGDPRSWTFQWYTHSIPGANSQVDRTPVLLAALSRIYGSNTGLNYGIASRMWIDCQPHYQIYDPPYDNNDDFLPWHRMYVYYFEEIIRSMSGHPEFTLPYWDYTDVNLQALPPEFLKPNDPVFKYLYRQNRNANSNNGRPITTGQRGSLDLSSMRSRNYSGTTGFCNALDNGLHGLVHDYTGNNAGMGSVPTAANDPIFWLHHSNIDRVWASWNRLGYPNPPSSGWRARSFLFVNGAGQVIRPTVGSVLDTSVLGYTFDKFLTPPGRGANLAAKAKAAAPTTLLASASRAIALTGGAVTVSLAASGSVKKAARFTDQLKAAAAGREVFLEIRGLSKMAEPGTSYDVYLGASQGAPPDPKFYAGSFAFFGIMVHAGHGGAGMATMDIVPLNVTELVERLADAGLDTDASVTLVASGTPEPGSEPSFQSVALVRG
jgi:tyrosinase